jgi:hypothetical protein
MKVRLIIVPSRRATAGRRRRARAKFSERMLSAGYSLMSSWALTGDKPDTDGI